jgi:hypothetical protein
MKMRFRVATIALALELLALPAFAGRTDTLYAYKSWKVEGVTFDDGTYACLAEVTDPGESFSIWTYPDQTIQLEFFSSDWSFTDGDTADLLVEIDRRGAWTLNGADLKENSVLFTLPDAKESVNFVVEVASGRTLHLRSADGTSVKDYSLAGSAASISSLVDCGTAISGDSNPFK